MNDHLLQDVYHVVHQLTHALGDAFSLERLLWFVERCRGKPLRLEERPLPAGKPGCCVALRDADVIFVRDHLDATRWLVVRLHECSHFLLQHVPQRSADLGSYTFAEFVRTPDLDGALARSLTAKPTSTEAQEREAAAELLATLLLPHVHTDHAIPQAAIDAYGYHEGLRHG